MTETNIISRPEGSAYRYYVLTLLTLTYLFSYMDRQIMSILIEDIGAEFAANGQPISDTMKGVLMGPVFGIFYATLGIPIARLADRASRKNIISGAITIWSAATAACAFATGIGSLVAARMMVGVGEAGGTAPSHSLLSDYFKKSEISRAIAVFSLGTTLGATIALMAGGLIADMTSWRTTFIIAAVPGLVIGALIYFTVKEPERGRFDPNYSAERDRMPFLKALSELSKNKPYVGTVLAHGSAVFVLYILTAWGAVLFIRNFGISKTEVGFLFGLAILIGGLRGMLAGGYFSDVLSKRDARWMGWIPALGCFLCIPAYIAALFAGSAAWMAVFFGIGGFVYNFAHAPSLGIIQAVVRPNQRAVGAAFAFFVSNFLGLILGPPLAGWLSQILKPTFGDYSLNYAFLIILSGMVVAGLGFIWTARHLKGFKVEEGASAH